MLQYYFWYCLLHIYLAHSSPNLPPAYAPLMNTTGRAIPHFRRDVLDVCTSAHLTLLPDVPLIGWDVALTEEAGPCLLELNISCNFFLGSYDRHAYEVLVRDYFVALQLARERQQHC